MSVIIPNSKKDESEDSYSVDTSAKIKAELEKIRREHSLDKDFTKDEIAIKANLEKAGAFSEGKMIVKGEIKKIKDWSENNPNLILEVADNGKFRVFERANQYTDPGERFLKKIELAEDDRVLGIPYAQAMAGDRVFIVNGKIFTGWALYFSLSSIKSPEDYARNVDLVYNVPYLFASVLLKAQLGLGCGFDVNYGSEAYEVPEEKLIRKYLFDKLKIDTSKLVKTGFHLYTYGNAYWALRRDRNGIVDKITILQPERLKIFLDPMTTRIMFYIYLPPIIGGTTIASYPSDGRYNPNILTGVTLSYPTPIVMHPEDVIHFKINDFTEYPFGFSDVKTCIDPATARLDVNILAPIIFKKYTKPMIHWALDTEGLGPQQINVKKSEMAAMLQDMEPGSDPITTIRWKPTIITVGGEKNDIFNLTNDMDTQIFASTGCPETYFKPKGSTDRMIAEQDKTFIARLKVPQQIVANGIEEKLINPRIHYEMKKKKEVDQMIEGADPVEQVLETYDSWLAAEPKLPKVQWKETFKQEETQVIANAIAMLNAGIIDQNRAAMKVGEIPPVQQAVQDQNKESITAIDTTEEQKKMMQTTAPGTPQSFNEQNTMERLRGGQEVNSNFDTRNRNVTQTKDPSQLGGSRYSAHKLHGSAGDIQEKHNHAFQDLELNDEIIKTEIGDNIIFTKKRK